MLISLKMLVVFDVRNPSFLDFTVLQKPVVKREEPGGSFNYGKCFVYPDA